MKSLFRPALVAACLCAAAAPVSAGEVRLSIANGRVTLFAKDATPREILAEWSRVGQTRIVNAEKVVGPPMTLELTDVPEAQALDTVLRSAAGYVMAPRMATNPGASVYDRILILATSRPPAVTVSTPTPFNRAAQPQPQPFQQMPTVDDDEAEPKEAPAQGVPPGTQLMPGPAPATPGAPSGTQAPMTAPRPGMLPQPQNVQPNPNPYQLIQPNAPAAPMPTAPGVPPQPPRRPGGGGSNQ